jgi:hypothetical protein
MIFLPIAARMPLGHAGADFGEPAGEAPIDSHILSQIPEWQEDRLGFQGRCSAMARGKGGGRQREGFGKQFGKLRRNNVGRLT